MKAKKTHRAELRSKIKSFQLLGLVVACSFTLISFEWKTFQYDLYDLGEVDIDEVEVDQIPITVREIPDLPKPKIVMSTDFKIVDDKTIIEDTSTIVIRKQGASEDTLMNFKFEEEKPEEENTVYVSVEKMPTLPGCEELPDEAERMTCTQQKLFYFLAKGQHYPLEMKQLGIDGTVHVEFIVNKKGKVKDVKVLRGVQGGKALDEEAVRMVKSLPDFTPGYQQGKAAKVKYTIPIRFKLK